MSFLAARDFLYVDLFKQSVNDLNHLVIDRTVAGDGFLERDRDDLVRTQSGHATESAALDMPENHGTGFEASALFNFTRQDVGNTSEFGVAELVFAHILHDRSASAFGELGALGDHHDREVTPALMPLPD